MCKQCVEAVKRHFPSVPDAEMGNFLINTTAFPFAHAEIIDDQLHRLRKKSGGDAEKAYYIADDESYEEFRKFREKETISLLEGVDGDGI